jgi:hypothetical protein
VDPLSRRSRFALRAAIAATAAHAASFGHPDERPQGAVNANGGIRELHWHQAMTPPECTEARFFLCLAGLGISYFPFIIPPSDTIWQAAELPPVKASC